MSKDQTFVVGTIVEAEWLNELQEVDTGLIWGLNLNQLSSNVDGIKTAVSGDSIDTRSSIIIGGQRRWVSSGVTAPDAGGVSGARKIVAWTDDDDDLNPGPGYPNNRDFNIEVIPVGNVASGTYSRTIGYADWNAGASTLYNIRLANGVQADATQYNAFTFQSIGAGNDDIPITISGKTTQDSDLAKMLSIGADDGGGYNERLYVSGSGLVTAIPDDSADIILRALTDPDANNRFQVHGTGEICWGDGTAVVDVCLERNAAESLRLDGLTGAGIFDVTYFQNSNLTQVPLGGVLGANNFLGPVNFMDDVYLNGALIDLSNLAHLDLVETFTADHTFDAALIMANSRDFVFSGDGRVDTRAHTSGAVFTWLSSVSGDAQTRFAMTAAGGLRWGSGTAAVDVSLDRGGADYLEMALGDQIRVQQDPVSGNDLARKSYVDNEVAAEAETQRAFAFFIGR